MGGFFSRPPVLSAAQKRLIQAAASGDTAALKPLLDRGVNVNVRDKDGWTPLIYASAFGHSDCVLVLLAYGGDKWMENKVRSAGQARRGGGVAHHCQIPTWCAVQPLAGKIQRSRLHVAPFE